jgi:threonyl-tRNA synthetase
MYCEWWYCYIHFYHRCWRGLYITTNRRWAELGTVYRYERSGTLSGLFRVSRPTSILTQYT